MGMTKCVESLTQIGSKSGSNKYKGSKMEVKVEVKVEVKMDNTFVYNKAFVLFDVSPLDFLKRPSINWII